MIPAITPDPVRRGASPLRLMTLFAALYLAALPAPAVEPEPAPPADALGESAEEPEVTIVRRGTDVIQEYRLHGQLYMIKVTPRRGVPYYLVDTDGDGNLETRRNNIDEHLLVPNWTLFRW